MTSFAIFFHRLVWRLSHFGWLWTLGLITIGLGLAATERFRPEMIAPARSGIASAASLGLDPIRVAAGRGRESAERLAAVWDAEADREEERDQIIRLQTELQLAREELRKMHRVAGMDRWTAPRQLEFLLADVLGTVTEDRAAVIVLGLGERHGIQPGLPVMGKTGLAGVVRETAAGSCRVQLLTDPLSAVGVMCSETRIRGVLVGSGHGLPLQFIPEDEVQPLMPGAELISSGLDSSLFPKGLTIGRISELLTNENGIVVGSVSPAQELDALEEVLVIVPASETQIVSREAIPLGHLTVTALPREETRPDLSDPEPMPSQNPPSPEVASRLRLEAMRPTETPPRVRTTAEMPRAEFSTSRSVPVAKTNVEVEESEDSSDARERIRAALRNSSEGQ